MKKLTPIRIIDYYHRGKIKRFAVNVPLDSEGRIRLEYTDFKINRENDFEWVKYKEQNLIKEYFSNDDEYKFIIKVWWLFARYYIKSDRKQGTHGIRDLYVKALKEVSKTHQNQCPKG